MNSFENEIDGLEEKYKHIFKKIGPYCDSINRGIKKAESLLRKFPMPDSELLDNFDITDEDQPLRCNESLREFLIFNGDHFIYIVWDQDKEEEIEAKRVDQLKAKLRVKVSRNIPFYINDWMRELESWMDKNKGFDSVHKKVDSVHSLPT